MFLMRITVIASSYPRFPGDGTAPFVQSISEHLAQLGHEVEAVAPYDPAVRPDPNQRVAVHRFRYTLVDKWHIMGHAKSLVGDTRFKAGVFFLLPFFALAEFWSALRVARRQRAEIIHAHWVLPNGLVGAWVARLLRVPLAISLHGSDVFVARRNPIFGWVAHWVFGQAAVITACSDDLRRGALELGALADKVHLVAWGADPIRFHPNVTPLNRSDFGLAEDDLVLVSLGRLVPKKGFDVLVRVLASLLPAHPRVHALIGGDGIQREQLGHLAAELGVSDRLHLPGQIAWDRVPGFLTMGDIFVLPSVRDAAGNLDGLPTVLPEAMACGKPVVATRIGGVPLVVEDKVNGLLCPPDDVTALSQAVESLLADGHLQAELGQAARNSIEERFNWQAVAKRFTALFEEVIRSRGETRLGSQYRLDCFRAYGVQFEGERVLDVGCHDTTLLSTLRGKLSVGVDLDPALPRGSVLMVRADACRLPFRSASFDQVIAADVIEHVPDDAGMMREMARVTRQRGKVFVTTPSADIRMFPPFLTGWISDKWGHWLRRGYTEHGLRSLVGDECRCTVLEWNAPAYRFWYLPLRLLSAISASLAQRVVNWVARWDARHPKGQRGFYWMRCEKQNG
jgi:glycosyltransferase involved in cell wall biosynthesis